MFTFFILLAVLIVLVVMAGSWMGGPGSRRRVIYERGPAMTRRPDVIEEIVEEPELRPIASRRIVRRRRTY
jgi:hypothetical protein